MSTASDTGGVPRGLGRRPQPLTDHRALRVVPASPPATVGEAITRWLATLSPEARVDRTSWATTHGAWAQALPLEAITEAEIAAVIAARALDGYQSSTLSSIADGWIMLMRSVGVVLRRSALGIPRKAQRSDRYAHILTAAEVAQLAHSERGPLDQRAAVVGLVTTGLRPSELRGARVRDIDTSGATWIARLGEQLHPKTGRRTATKDRATREVPLRAELRALLERLWACYGDTPPPDAPAWPSFVGGRAVWWSRGRLASAWARVLEAHGIAPRPTYTARHTWASLLRATGVEPIAARSITHPASLPEVGGPEPGRAASYARYLHATTAQRVAVVQAVRLPIAEVTPPVQGELVPAVPTLRPRAVGVTGPESLHALLRMAGRPHGVTCPEFATVYGLSGDYVRELVRSAQAHRLLRANGVRVSKARGPRATVWSRI